MTTAETARRLAALHAQAFTVPPPWPASAFAVLLEDPAVFLVERPRGLALGRQTLDEAELLTIAVAPEARGRGLGRALLHAWERAARGRGVATAHLEVAADNRIARSLYARAGWQQVGRRRGYYLLPDGRRIDAVLMRRALAEAASPAPADGLSPPGT